MIKKVLTIAGSDPSGGAGIQADIKTITVHKMYALSAITALTAQNTMGVSGIFEISPKFVEQQLDSIFSDIPPDAVKIGMVSNVEIIKSIAKKLREYGASNVVLDPVMVATSGSKLLSDDAKVALIEHLMPLSTVITPNIPEAMILSGFNIKNENDMMLSAKDISKNINGSVLIKGGHLVNDANDYLYQDGNGYWFSSPRIDNKNTHGTGCTLSSAIACGLADNLSLHESIKSAKSYLNTALSKNLDFGKGSGPLQHFF